jgi:hypothetical protein
MMDNTSNSLQNEGTRPGCLRLSIGKILILLILFLLSLQNYLADGDGAIRFRFLTALYDQHVVSKMEYSMVMPIFSLPILALDRLLNLNNQLIFRFNFIMLCILILFCYVHLKKLLSKKFAIDFCLLILAASMIPGSLTDYYGEMFTAVFLTIGIMLIASSRWAIGWSLVCLAVVNTPALIVSLAMLAIFLSISRRDYRHFLPVLIAMALIMADMYLRNGALSSGYEGSSGFKTIMPYSGLPGFSYPFFFGLLSILFSFGRGILFYIPGVLAIWHSAGKLIKNEIKLKTMVSLLSVVVLGEIAVYSKWWAWYGGVAWGPRFFIVACIPAALAMCIRLRQSGNDFSYHFFTIMLVVFSTWVAIVGTAFGGRAINPICFGNNYALEVLCWYTPENSSLFFPLVGHLPIYKNGVFLVITYCISSGYLLFDVARQAAVCLKNSLLSCKSAYGNGDIA